MRILHTSDWHLGIQSSRISRLKEHELFFDWLLETLSTEQVDALIVAGDIFDGMNPSNEALRTYYRFLRRLETTGVRNVVIVGGNHDSPSLLDAPKAVLSALDVHVVGGYSSEEDAQTYLAPLRSRGSDEVQAVCLALPYVHEYRLGVRTTDGDVETTRAAFTERFAQAYSRLADRAEQLYPGLPLIGTGHLTMGKTESGDFPQEIHQVGLIDSISPAVLDSRLSYVALGHIHRSFPVERDRVWYSGSPIPVSLPEMRHPRRVLRVDLPDKPALDAGAHPVIEPLPVPVRRALLEKRGSEEEVKRWIAELTIGKDELPPLLHLRVHVQEPEPQLSVRLHTALEGHPVERRPIVAELRAELDGVGRKATEEHAVALEDLSAKDVFARLCGARGVQASDDLLQAFHLVATAREEDISERVEAIEHAPQRLEYVPAEELQ